MARKPLCVSIKIPGNLYNGQLAGIFQNWNLAPEVLRHNLSTVLPNILLFFNFQFSGYIYIFKLDHKPFVLFLQSHYTTIPMGCQLHQCHFIGHKPLKCAI